MYRLAIGHVENESVIKLAMWQMYRLAIGYVENESIIKLAMWQMYRLNRIG